MLNPRTEEIAKIIVNSAFKVHKELGPGLLERVYEVCLEHEIKKAGLLVKRQIDIPIVYDGIEFTEGLRLDLLVDDSVIIEVKAAESNKLLTIFFFLGFAHLYIASAAPGRPNNLSVIGFSA